MLTKTDVAIIGAGPIGIELAVALQRAGIDYLHFDARQIGHTISWFAPDTRFFSSNERIAIAGVPLQTPDQSKATREQYLAYLRGVVQQFDLPIRTYEPVKRIDRIDGGFRLTTEAGGEMHTHQARRLVLATGGTATPRRLNIPGENLPHVSSYFQDPHTYFRKRVLIVGGRNSAIEAALRCHHAGAQVMLSYRRPHLYEGIKYWLLPEIRGLIESGRITTWFGTRPVEITPAHVTLAPVETAGGAGGAETLGELVTEPFDVRADFVLLLIGYEANMELCRMAGVELLEPQNVPRFDERTMETNVPGVYVAGTVIGGTQERYRVFIENCHIHVDRIVAALTGAPPPEAPAPYSRPET